MIIHNLPRRMIIQNLTVCLLAGMLLVGCGSTGGTGPVKIAPANPHLHKIAYPKRYLAIEHVELLTNQSSGLLNLNIHFFNRRPSGTAFRYRVHWYDRTGAVLSSADQGWTRATMNHGHSPLLLVALNKNAEDFSLIVEKGK